VRKGVHESQPQIDLKYKFTHFSSERGMKPGCVKSIPLQTFARVNLRNMEFTLTKLLE